MIYSQRLRQLANDVPYCLILGFTAFTGNNGNLGNAYFSLGEYQKAIDHYETGLEISTAIGDRSGIASNNGNLGNGYFSLGEYQEAIVHYKTGLEISTAIGDRLGIASNNVNYIWAMPIFV